MNKAQLIEEVMKSNPEEFATKAQAERALTAVINAVKKGLKKDRSVQLIGFGTFTVKQRKPRKGRNPRTGAEMTIPKSKTVAFRCGKKLKEQV